MAQMSSTWARARSWLQERLRKADQEPKDDSCAENEELFETDWSPNLNVGLRIGELILFGCAAAFIIAVFSKIAAEIFSVGGLVNWIALVMAASCKSGGPCSEPALLTTFVIVVLILVFGFLAMLWPIRDWLFPDHKSEEVHDHLEAVEQKVDALYDELQMARDEKLESLANTATYFRASLQLLAATPQLAESDVTKDLLSVGEMLVEKLDALHQPEPDKEEAAAKTGKVLVWSGLRLAALGAIVLVIMVFLGWAVH